jgi:hypothetical protein
VRPSGYPDEERTVIDCLGVVMDEEIEHYRFAVRDLEILESIDQWADGQTEKTTTTATQNGPVSSSRDLTQTSCS